MSWILATIAAAAALVLAFALARARRDVRGLTQRLARGDAQSLASLDVDSFGSADELASAVYRLLSEGSRQLAGERRQLDLMQQIIGGVGEGVVAVDRQRRIVLTNRRFAELFALHGDLVARPIGEVVRMKSVFAAFDRALERTPSTERLTLPTAEGERKIEMRAFPLPSNEIAAVALFIDVTQLEHLEQVRRDFIADFSHEVRTPLAGLRSAVESFELGAGRNSAEDELQLRRIMTRQLRRLERLVDDLSELTRIESGDLTLDRRPVDVRQLVDDLCEDFAERAAQRNLRFVVAGEPVSVTADALRIQQALSNLIDNAIKYGGSQSTIDIDVIAERDAALVRVRDHGDGIAPEERQRIFNRFYRVDKSRSQDVAGTGLGLAVTRHLIRLHGGTIDVENAPGGGAAFIVRLPR